MTGGDRAPAGEGADPPPAASAERVRLTAWVRGDVQGVGFRYWVRRRALALGLTGSATNLAGGEVEVIAVGAPPACAALLEALRGPDAPGRVGNLTHRIGAATDGVAADAGGFAVG